jgi:hypothetical protein
MQLVLLSLLLLVALDPLLHALDRLLFQGETIMVSATTIVSSTPLNAPPPPPPTNQPPPKGAIVFLAPQRNEGSIWGHGLDRFCMLLRAVRSVDQHLNAPFGPYPIFILVANDSELDPKHKDGVYSDVDQALIRQWAPHSTIQFVPIALYSGDALEPGTTREQILEWRTQGNDGAVAGRDLGYTSMCRLWSGRLQQMSFLDGYTYYLRMDDDSLFTEDLPFDPFCKMQTNGLTYAYRRDTLDHWGIDKLWQVTKPHLPGRGAAAQQETLPFLDDSGGYSGRQPYNNFHVSRVDFWRSDAWQDLWREYNRHHLFFKYRVGDANVHAMAIMLMGKEERAVWPQLPYVHNSNDYGPAWGKEAPAWGKECQRDYDEFLKGQ